MVATAAIGESVELSKGSFPIVACQKCGKAMVDLHADDIAKGDLAKLKSLGVLIGNPATVENLCINCDLLHRPSMRAHLASYFSTPSAPRKDDDDDSDSGFFHSSSSSGGSSSGGGFSFGGFGGFGGGGFSGGGASGGF
jgi:hypothetical protein